jgi:hypothetical protein
VDTAQISVIIGLAAFGVAAYGIFERRRMASTSERIRLTSIVDEITQVRYSLTELGSKGTTSGNLVEAANSRIEILSQQALALTRQHEVTITSSECREVALGLEETGYLEDSDEMWELAQKRAQKEGDTQVLFAARGYAWFLFRSQREAEAREVLRQALSRHPTEIDSQRLAHAETLSIWATWEIETQGPGAEIVAELAQQINELADACTTPRGKAMIAPWAISIARGEVGDGGQHPK